MGIVIQEDTGTKSAWSELEHFVLKREQQWQTGQEAPEFARYEKELRVAIYCSSQKPFGRLKRYSKQRLNQPA
jgi:hypothetical protein